MKIATKC